MKNIEFSARKELVKAIELYTDVKEDLSNFTNEDLIMLTLAMLIKGEL